MVARVEGSPPRLELCVPSPVDAQGELLSEFLRQIFELQKAYLLHPRDETWTDVALGALSASLGCPPTALIKLLKGRGIAVGSFVVPLDTLVGVERFSPGRDVGFVSPSRLIPTDSVRSRAVIDDLVEVFKDRRQALLDPVLVVPHPTDDELGYVCEGNHRAAAAHAAKAKVRIRLLRSKDAIQFYLSGSLAARLAESSTYAAFVSVCGEQAARYGYEAGSWELYRTGASEAHALKILAPEAAAVDTTSDALRAAILELFEGLPGREFSAREVAERLRLMGVPGAALPSLERLELQLRYSSRKLREISPGRFTLRDAAP